jgi:hypothetical protein
MSLHLEDPLISDFEVLPPLGVTLQHSQSADLAFGAIEPDCQHRLTLRVA